MNTISHPDPLDLIRSLTEEDVEARLRQVKSEERQLMTLLRSIRCREREARRRAKGEPTNAA